MQFQKINIEISNICNLQCSFCPPVERIKGFMNIDTFKKILPQARNLTSQICLHLMGEPLLHPNLSEFLDLCLENNVPVFFVTNGVLAREKNYDLLLHKSIRQVNFSLHSFPNNFPNKDFSDYLNNIIRWTELAFLQRPDLYINYRLWNLQHVNTTLTSKDFDTNLRMLDYIKSYFSFSFKKDLIELNKFKSIHIKEKLYLHFDSEFIWPSLQQEIRHEQGFCHALTGHFGILVDGTVVPCCLDKEGVMPLGNVNTGLLVDILNSERAQKMKKGFQKNKLTEELCKRCQYIERFESKH